MSSWFIRDESPYQSLFDCITMEFQIDTRPLQERFDEIKKAISTIGDALAPAFQKMGEQSEGLFSQIDSNPWVPPDKFILGMDLALPTHAHVFVVNES